MVEVGLAHLNDVQHVHLVDVQQRRLGSSGGSNALSPPSMMPESRLMLLKSNSL